MMNNINDEYLTTCSVCSVARTVRPLGSEICAQYIEMKEVATVPAVSQTIGIQENIIKVNTALLHVVLSNWAERAIDSRQVIYYLQISTEACLTLVCMTSQSLVTCVLKP